MGTVLYDKDGLFVMRGWSDEQNKPRISISLKNQGVTLNQEQLNRILPVLQGFAASLFSKPEVA